MKNKGGRFVSSQITIVAPNIRIPEGKKRGGWDFLLRNSVSSSWALDRGR